MGARGDSSRILRLDNHWWCFEEFPSRFPKQASNVEFSFEEVFTFLHTLEDAKMVMDAIDGNLSAPTFWARYLRGGNSYEVLSDTSFRVRYTS